MYNHKLRMDLILIANVGRATERTNSDNDDDDGCVVLETN